MTQRRHGLPGGTGTSPLVSREGTAGPYTYRGHVAEPRDIVAAVHARLAALGRLPDPPPGGHDEEREATGD